MKQLNICENNSGFIALFTAVILSAVLILVVVTLNQSGFITRSEILDSEFKNRSSALAEACVDKALLELAKNPTYGGNETIAVGSDSCTIRPIVPPSSGEIIIETRAIYQSAVTNLKIILKDSDLSIKSWNEIP